MKKNQFGGEAMKEILNPNRRGNDKIWSRKNKEDLKLIEEKKKRNKEQKDLENELLHKNDQYKLEAFKNIPSKLKENTKNWINNEQSKHKPIQKSIPLSKIKSKSVNKPMTSSKPNRPIRVGENIYNVAQEEPKSMFDKYYSNKMRTKSPSANIRVNENYNEEKDNYTIIDNDGSVTNNRGAEIEKMIKEYKEKYGSDEELEKMISDYNINLNKPESNINENNIGSNVQKGNNMKTNVSTSSTNKRKREVQKGPTPTVNDAPIILPKIQRNYIRENRQLVMDNKITNKNKFIEEKNDAKHKNYGKVPDYIKKYEL